jgi:hypothetical protein
MTTKLDGRKLAAKITSSAAALSLGTLLFQDVSEDSVITEKLRTAQQLIVDETTGVILIVEESEISLADRLIDGQPNNWKLTMDGYKIAKPCTLTIEGSSVLISASNYYQAVPSKIRITNSTDPRGKIRLIEAPYLPKSREGDICPVPGRSLHTSMCTFQSLTHGYVLIGPKKLRSSLPMAYDANLSEGNIPFWGLIKDFWTKRMAGTSWSDPVSKYSAEAEMICKFFGVPPNVARKFPVGFEFFLQRALSGSLTPTPASNIKVAREYFALCTAPSLPPSLKSDAWFVLQQLVNKDPGAVLQGLIDMSPDYGLLQDWYSTCFKVLIPPFDIKSMQKVLAPLQASNVKLFNQIICALLAKTAAETGIYPNSSAWTTRSHGFTAMVELLKSLEAEDDPKRVTIIAMGTSVSVHSLILEATWKYFQRFIKVLSSDNGKQTQGRVLDFGDRFSPGAVKSLVEYFRTGKPTNTSYVDAFSLLEMAEELELCDSKGNGTHGHVALITQLVLTLLTTCVTTDEAFIGLTLSYAHQNSKLREQCEIKIRSSFSECCSSPFAERFSQHFPTEYGELAWSCIPADLIRV